MAANVRGLGKGLDALFKGFDEVRAAPEVRLLPLTGIRPNPDQPRKDIAEDALAELTESIKSQGVVQPILVRPIAPEGEVRYEIVAGERRFRASLQAGLKDIPALIREMSDRESLAIALVENLQRENLNPLEEAVAMSKLISDWGLTQEELGTRIGKSRSSITNALRLLQLPEEIKAGLGQSEISAGHARALLGVGDETARKELYARVIDYGLSVRQTEEQAAYFREHGHLPDADVHIEPEPEPRRRPKGAPGDKRLKTLGKTLGAELQLKVSIRGNLDNGRISLAYASRDDLVAFLSRFGMDVPESEGNNA